MAESPRTTIEPEAFNFRDTTATQKVFSLTKRIRAVAGGTSASKTISILVWLIDYCQSNRGKLVSIVSESMPHLTGGAMRDFEAIMRDRGYWDEDRWVRNPRVIYTFETGSKIEFFSPDTSGKAHGPRRDVLFVNEANNMDYDIVDQLITRTHEVVWMDWNPTNEFWFYTEMKPNRKDIDFITLTYLDNEGLKETTRQEIESHKNNLSWWKVYGLGQLGEVEGKIYRDWKIIDEIPHEARLERYGVDFGYSNDPTAIVAIYYYNGGYILDEIAYAKGMSNKFISDTISAQEQKALVIADSAEPKSIAEMIELKVNVIGVEKRRGETKDQNFKKWSIGVVQQQRISVTKRSVNVIREYRNYLWETDKDGKILNVPEHAFSHSMDAISYGFVSIFQIGSQHIPKYVPSPTEPLEFEWASVNPSVAREHGPMQNVFNTFQDARPNYERGEFE